LARLPREKGSDGFPNEERHRGVECIRKVLQALDIDFGIHGDVSEPTKPVGRHALFRRQRIFTQTLS
jgi:hypothetical protein